MKATMLLCDHAVVAEGKLYISGGGWSLTGPGPSPTAIALLLAVPWDWANRKIKMILRLQDADGTVVTDGNDMPIEILGDIEVGRPAGIAPGSSLDLPLAINVGALALEPGKRYAWQLSINDETAEDWHLPFAVRTAPVG